MKIETIASLALPLGEVDPSWHTAQFDRNLHVGMKYSSHDDQGRLTYNGVLEEDKDIFTPVPFEEHEILVSNVRTAVRTIDRMVRDHRQYDDDMPTAISTVYRVGYERTTGLRGIALQSLFDHVGYPPISYVPSGITHFDRSGAPQDDEATENSVILSHRGTPTIVYEGPVIDAHLDVSEGESISYFVKGIINSFFFANVVARLSAGPQVVLPNDTAVLIYDRTLHKQARQIYRTSEPSVFLRAIVKPA